MDPLDAVRQRISILPPPFECADCGAECEATVTYDPVMKERVDAWVCPACGAQFYREADPDTGVVHRGVARLTRSLHRGKD